MKKILLILSIFLLTGCYDYTEINKLAIISGMIIDYQDNEYVITSQVIQNEKESNIRVVTTKGKSIDECVSKISKSLNKNIFISHLKVLLLTESIIKNDIEYEDYFLRNSKSKMNYYVYYIDDKYKDKIFLNNINDKASSLYLKDLTDFNNDIYSSSNKLTFLDLMYKKLNYGIEPIYPNITMEDKNISLNDLVLFKNNEKITLNNEESIFYNIITNNTNKTTLTIPCDNDNFSIELNNIKTKYKWNNKFNINIKFDAKINSYNCKYKLQNNKTTNKLSKLVNNYINKKSKDVVNIAVNNKIDFIGIGNYIYKHDSKYFDFKKNDWNDHLDKINIKINTDSIIKSIGEMRK